MEKMSLYAYTDGAYKTKHAEKITLLLNPESVKFSKDILYRDDKQLGAIGGGTRFERYKPETLSFDVVIDCTGMVEGTSDSDTAYGKVKELEDALYSYNSEGHRPSYVAITYGELLFKGQLSEMKSSYNLFNQSGEPIRAKVSFVFTGFRGSEEERKKFSKLSPDMSRMITLKDGETLATICHHIYGDSQLVTEVARFNNLVGFRGIAAGTEIILPPLKK